MKKYKITYPVAIGCACLAAFFGGVYWLKVGFKWSIIFSIAVALLAWLVSRVTLHLVEKDNSAKTWQLNIYVFCVLAGWIVAVIFEQRWLISGGLALCALGVTMFLGVRFDDENDNGIPDTVESIAKSAKAAAKALKERKKMSKEELKAELRYRPQGDVIGNPDDLERPMVCIDGQPKTIAEAIETGHAGEANEAERYLNEIYKEEGEDEK